MAGAATASVNTFEPSYDLIQEEDCNTLLLYLPEGFTKDQLKVQLTRTRDLNISGSRQLEDKTWSAFHKEFHVAEDCDTNKITAKFEDGIVYVRQPRSPQKPTPSQPPHPQPHKPADKPKIDPPRPAPKVDPPTPTPKTADEVKQTATAKKSVDESREAKKKSSEGEGEKKEEIRKRAEEKSSGGAAAAAESSLNKI